MKLAREKPANGRSWKLSAPELMFSDSKSVSVYCTPNLRLCSPKPAVSKYVKSNFSSSRSRAEYCSLT